MAFLPFDILSTITEEFSVYDAEEFDTLKALSLSCRTLLPICQKTIFKRVEFVIHSKSRVAVSRFSDMLNNSPHIASYVLCFIYSHSSSDLEDGTVSTLTGIIYSLNRLTELHLYWHSNLSTTNQALDWLSLRNDPRSEGFCNAIDSVLAKKDLVDLNIQYIKNFPFSNFTGRSSLLDVKEDNHFCIQLTIVEHATNTATPLYSNIRNYSVGCTNWPRRLTEITLDGHVCLSSPSSGVPPFSFASAQGILICITAEMQVVEAAKLLRSARSIEELSYEVSCSSGFHGFGRAILVGSASTLTTLQVIISVEATDDPFHDLCEELEHLSSHNVLQHLDLDVSLDSNNCPLDQHHLNQLDSTIHKNGFPHLRTFDLYLRILENSPWDDTAGPQPSLADIDSYHLQHLGTLRSTVGLDFCYSSTFISLLT